MIIVTLYGSCFHWNKLKISAFTKMKCLDGNSVILRDIKWDKMLSYNLNLTPKLCVTLLHTNLGQTWMLLEEDEVPRDTSLTSPSFLSSSPASSSFNNATYGSGIRTHIIGLSLCGVSNLLQRDWYPKCYLHIPWASPRPRCRNIVEEWRVLHRNV